MQQQVAPCVSLGCSLGTLLTVVPFWFLFFSFQIRPSQGSIYLSIHHFAEPQSAIPFNPLNKQNSSKPKRNACSPSLNQTVSGSLFTTYRRSKWCTILGDQFNSLLFIFIKCSTEYCLNSIICLFLSPISCKMVSTNSRLLSYRFNLQYTHLIFSKI